MPSVTSWTRLEPRSRTNLEERTLEARIHDPLWMLARQWQLGEWKAEDAGSPIVARLRGTSTTIQRFYPGALPVQDFARVRAYAGEAPLEVLVERERVHTGAGVQQTLEVSYEAGVQFLRLLGPALAAKYGPAYVAAYGFPPLPQEQRAALDAESVRMHDLVAPRAIDGGALHAAFKAAAGGMPPRPVIGAVDEAAVKKAAQTWLAMHDAIFDEPDGNHSAWSRERLEYAAAVSTDTPAGEVVLRAPEYAEGSLDWYSFDLAPAPATLRPPGKRPDVRVERIVSTTLPSPVRYGGMPTDRWWELEDGRVNLGQVDAGPPDLGRMLMLEFALVYGNDWFVIPIELPVGAVFRTSSLVVTDTFGIRLLIPPSIAKQTPGQTFRMFELTGSTPQSNVFFLAPTLADNLHGEPLEEVLFLRDEMANMAWAVEKTVESPIGVRVDRISEDRRRREAQRTAAEAAQPLPAEPITKLRYRLSSEVPAPWVPLVPQQVAPGSADVRLRRGALLMADGSHELATAQGRILGGDALSLYEEEVPRDGARVTRGYQLARWIDGSSHLWIGRRKQAGRGEGSSGLRFDFTEPNKE